jgi:hypothetical protein
MASALSSPLLGTGPKSRHTGSALAEPPPRTPPTPRFIRADARHRRGPTSVGSAARRWREPKDLLFASFTHHENGCPRQLLFASFTHHENGCPRQLLFASFSHHETGCPRAVAFRALHPPRNWVPPGSCFSRPSPTTKLGAPGPSPLGTGDRTNPTQEAFYPGHERGAHPVGGSQPHVARPTWRQWRVAG